VKWKDTPSIDKIEGKFNSVDGMTTIWAWRSLDCGEIRVTMTVKPKRFLLGLDKRGLATAIAPAFLSPYTSLSNRGSRPFFPGFFYTAAGPSVLHPS
jgi:hypothetical protein